MEKTLTTTKGHIHQKSIEQAGKGVGLATRIMNLALAIMVGLVHLYML
jgi:hypothetical protein